MEVAQLFLELQQLRIGCELRKAAEWQHPLTPSALGKGTSDEMFLMVTQKLDAMEQAKAVVIRGGDPSYHRQLSEDCRSEYRALFRHLKRLDREPRA